MEKPKADAFEYYRRIKKVKNHIEANYCSHVSLSGAAKMAGLERKYFSRFFKNKTGICFKDWVAVVRIKQSQAMLMKQDYTVTETCFAVGFRDLRTFERTFKKHTGMTPSEFKASVAPSLHGQNQTTLVNGAPTSAE